MNRRCHWGCLLLLGSACGAASSPGTGTAPVASAAGDSSSTPAPSASSAAAPAPPVGQLEARIVTIADSKESAGYKRVKIEFRNTTSRPCSILGYELQWPGGKKPAKLEGVVLPPGESRERWLRVDHHDGDVSSLSEAAARLTLESDCPASKP